MDGCGPHRKLCGKGLEGAGREGGEMGTWGAHCVIP